MILEKITRSEKECPVKAFFAVGMIFVLLLSVSPIQAQSSQAQQAPASVASDLVARITKVKGLKLVSRSSLQAPTDLSCQATVGVPCYSPQQIQNAYGLTPILQAGYTGVGQTIVIVDSYGSPTMAQDLHAFDAAYGLPDPPSFTVLAPLGTVPFDPNNGEIVGWGFETTLDVEWSHAMAPGANIVLLTSPVDETEGVQGMPQFLALEEYALEHKLGKIITQSWGATENTLFTPAGQAVFAGFESFYKRAALDNITVLAAAGDSGSSNVELDGVTNYPFPTVGYPSSSPNVTAVGGTSLYADPAGKYQFEIVWNDHYLGAGAGGVSQQFAEPYYQYSLPASVQSELNNYRGIPDVSLNADPNTPILVYIGFLGGSQNGFYSIGGTSESSPQWAGIIADANQLAGRPLGFLNPKLYAVGEAGGFFHDITWGNNAFNLNAYLPASSTNIPGYVEIVPGLVESGSSRLSARYATCSC
jgi:subtilase family serine protease